MDGDIEDGDLGRESLGRDDADDVTREKSYKFQ